MIGRTRLIAIAATLALACLPASARADITGDDYWRLCTSKDAGDEGFCSGYVAAIAAAVILPNAVSGWRACFPEHSTGQQKVDVVKRWLDQHPELRHHPASYLVAQALAEAFPCKQ
jgi:hypothetical protein